MLVRSFTGLIVLSMWVDECGVEIYDDIDQGRNYVEEEGGYAPPPPPNFV